MAQNALPPRSSGHLPVVDRLETTEQKVRKEIAIMKKLRHPHIVRLFEVIDDRLKDKIYMGKSSERWIWPISLWLTVALVQSWSSWLEEKLSGSTRMAPRD